MKVYCDDCEHLRIESMGICEPSIYWCHVFDKKIDEFWGTWLKGQVKCKKQNQHNDCQFFSHK